MFGGDEIMLRFQMNEIGIVVVVVAVAANAVLLLCVREEFK